MTTCDIRIWHTLAEVELFVYICSIDVLYCFAHFFYFAICSLYNAVMFADMTGIGIIDILRRQCHIEIYA